MMSDCSLECLDNSKIYRSFNTPLVTYRFNFLTKKISIAMHPLIKRAFGSQMKLPGSGPILVESPVVVLADDAFIHLNNAFCITVAN